MSEIGNIAIDKFEDDWVALDFGISRVMVGLDDDLILLSHQLVMSQWYCCAMKHSQGQCRCRVVVKVVKMSSCETASL